MRAVLLTCLIFQAGTLAAAPFNIVGTGDSNTSGYVPNSMFNALLNEGLIGVANPFRLAAGGATSAIFTGQEVDPKAYPTPRVHNIAYESINGPAMSFQGGQEVWTVPPDPNVVILMLGTNDAIAAVSKASVVDDFKRNMTDVFNYYSTAVTPSGKHPQIVVATPIPIISTSYPGANAILSAEINPWLRAQAVSYGFTLVDLNAQIQLQTNWQRLYSDGVHMYHTGGYDWMARTLLKGILDTRPGDANLDGQVDGLDYIAWSTNFRKNTGRWADGDFNHDGVVDGADYIMWAANFSGGAAAAQAAGMTAIPEPGTAVLAVFAFAGLLILHSRQRR